MSGLIVFTDGQQNAGIEPTAVFATAREASIPIFPIGIGSNRQNVNVRVSDFVAPARAYPGDKYTATGYLQVARSGRADRHGRIAVERRGAGLAQRRRRPARSSPRSRSRSVATAKSCRSRSKWSRMPWDARRSDPARRTAPPGHLRRRRSAGSRYRDRRSQNQGAAVRRRSDARISVPAQSAAPRQGHGRRCLVADRRRRDLARCQRNSGRLPSHPRRTVRVRLHRGFRSRLAQSRATQIDAVERWISEQAGGLIVIAGPIYSDALGARRSPGEDSRALSGRVQSPAVADGRRALRFEGAVAA